MRRRITQKKYFFALIPGKMGSNFATIYCYMTIYLENVGKGGDFPKDRRLWGYFYGFTY